jgi:lipoprotein-anchoring transpeptidase ErfK/SrfK
MSTPAFASLLNSVPAPTQENQWAPFDIPKPAITPIDVSAFAPPLPDTPTSVPTDAPADPPTSIPTEEPAPTSVPTEAPTFTPEATETPGTIAMEIVPDTPTSDHVPPADAPDAPLQYASSGNGARWIDVNLSQQRVYAYEGDVVVNSFIVSTGTWRTPTVTGKYKVWIKLRSTTMSGPGYYLTNVPYTMYFHKGYGLHGTYWHNNFGTPMSHGCVNLTIGDAAWLYDWASVGTVVNVHY